jgi:L-ascorbate metabolism protein UlaG (beta-lactamase superfamily)
MLRAATLALLALAACQSAAVALGQPDGDLFPVPEANTITFWGHSCLYVDVDGFGITIDPVFERLASLRWRRAPVPPPASYAGTRLILISHTHPDHLSLSTIRTFPADAAILCPEPAERYISTPARTVRAMKPGETLTFPGGKVVAVVAKHAGTRYGIWSQTDGGALGYVIYTPYSTVYYSGDTNLFAGIDDVARDHAPDIAILNISGHLHGEDAVEAADRLGARVVIPVHFGAYGYVFMPAAKRPRDYDELARGLGERMAVLGLGESFPLGGGTR